MRKISPLKLEIMRRGLIQADVAQAAGMSEARLSRLLNGRAEIREYERKNLARALGVVTEELVV